MNSTLGHSLPQQALCCHSGAKKHHTCRGAHQAGTSSCFPPRATSASSKTAPYHYGKLLFNSFLGNNITVMNAKPQTPGSKMAATMIPCAALAADRAPKLAGKFNLEENSELRILIQNSTTSSVREIIFEVTNCSSPLILHWGAIRPGRKEWFFPSHRPNGTIEYKNRALRTPFIRSGSNLSLEVEIIDHEIEAVEFLILDESHNKWFKDNGQNFQVQLTEIDSENASVPPPHNANITLPEDLVQIQAYLRWERKGRQTYTPEQEKEEYEAARSELLEKINGGTSVEELRKRLTESPNVDEDKKPKNAKTLKDEIPNDLVQVQAYIRWETAGKPNYSLEKQLTEFEEAKKELKVELDKGTSLAELRKKIMTGNIKTKVSKQLKNKRYFSVERIQRKQRDEMQLLNNNVADIVEDKEQHLEEALEPATSIDLYTNTIEQQDHLILNKKRFKMNDGKELLVLVTDNFGKPKVHLATDMEGPLILHWALSRNPGEWMVPSSSSLPAGSVVLEKSCETHFGEISSSGLSCKVLEIEIDGSDYIGMPFVLRTNEQWIKNNGFDFLIDFHTGHIKTFKDAGDGRGTAKALLNKIAELEADAQRSLMHRFNIASDLVDEAKNSGLLGLSGILVWMRFMASRQLIWNKNYNVKPRYLLDLPSFSRIMSYIHKRRKKTPKFL